MAVDEMKQIAARFSRVVLCIDMILSYLFWRVLTSPIPVIHKLVVALLTLGITAIVSAFEFKRIEIEEAHHGRYYG